MASATCGLCKRTNVDVAHVRACYQGSKRKVYPQRGETEARLLDDVNAHGSSSTNQFVSDIDEEEADWASNDVSPEERAEYRAHLDELTFLNDRTIGIQSLRIFDPAFDEREDGWSERTLEAVVDSSWHVADSRTRYNEPSRYATVMTEADEAMYKRKWYRPSRLQPHEVWKKELWRLGMLCPVHNLEYRDCGC